MARFRVRRLAALALPAVLIVALSGCSIFAPDEGDVGGAQAGVVDRPGDQFLAGSALAAHQYGNAGLADFLHLTEDAAHRLADADHLAVGPEPFQLRPQAERLAAQLNRLGGPARGGPRPGARG